MSAPHSKQEVWDYDSPYGVLLSKKDGRDLIVHMSKSGCAFVFDKNDGSIENIWPISDVRNFVKDIDKKADELIGRVELPTNQETLIPSTLADAVRFRRLQSQDRTLEQQRAE
jgi:alcohol dehydrogenase (cytochrome c)